MLLANRLSVLFAIILPLYILGVSKEGDNFVPFHLNPAIILKLHSPKVPSNPNNLLVTANSTGVITSVYMRDAFNPYLVRQLQKLAGEALVVLDSASAHISPAVLNAFRQAGIWYAIILGGLTMYIQAIDVALVTLYREEHHALYMHMVELRTCNQ